MTAASSVPCLLRVQGARRRLLRPRRVTGLTAVRPTAPLQPCRRGSPEETFSTWQPPRTMLFPRIREPGCPGQRAPRLERTPAARASLTWAPERGARYRFECGAGTVRRSQCSGESFLLATNPGVEAGALSGAALPSLLTLAAAQKTRRGGVQAAGASASRRVRRVRETKGAGRAGAGAQPRWACSVRDRRRRAPGGLHLPSPVGGRRALVPARRAVKGHLAWIPGARRPLSRLRNRRVEDAQLSDGEQTEAMPPSFATRVWGGARRKEARPAPVPKPLASRRRGASLRRPGQGSTSALGLRVAEFRRTGGERRGGLWGSGP